MDKRIESGEIIPLEDVLSKFSKETENLINTLDEEDRAKPSDTIDNVLNEKRGLIHSNNLKKESFINEMKSGLGEEVKNNANKIRLVEKPKLNWFKRFSNTIKGIFTKF
tara:strand:+ start:98048 stop:98374 length:327 start_codon:yes stop_codon:yes gene_type:complete